MSISDKKIEEAVEVFKAYDGIMRTSEVLNEGIHQRTLYYMRDSGIVQKLDRGIYQLTGSEPVSNPDLVVVAKKIPDARICLISALAIHNMTDQIPHKVHIALSHYAWEPKMEYPLLKVYRFSEETLNAGIQIRKIDGLNVKVYNPAKTIADCFKFRNQIGKDVAIEALKEGIKTKKATYREILKYAQLCKVKNVMQPYLEAIAHE